MDPGGDKGYQKPDVSAAAPWRGAGRRPNERRTAWPWR